MINIQELNRLDKEIREKYCDSVLDGIIDTALYKKIKPKILWILKETNDSGGGDWDLREFLSDKGKLTNYDRWKSTYGLVIRVSYGIIMRFPPFSIIDSEVDEHIDYLKKIAVINVNKLPGDSQITLSKLKKAYDKFKDILIQQINFINPDIIIGGNTLHLFYNNLNIKESEVNKNYHSTHFTMKDNRLWIDAYHPGQTQITHKQYYNEIMDIVKDNML